MTQHDKLLLETLSGFGQCLATLAIVSAELVKRLPDNANLIGELIVLCVAQVEAQQAFSKFETYIN